MKDWMTAIATSVAFLVVGFAVYYALDHWTRVPVDASVAATGIAIFAASPLAAFVTLWALKRSKKA